MFSFSDDVLGFGAMAGGAGGTPECGSRPNCIGNGSACQAKREAFNKCTEKAMQLKILENQRQNSGDKTKQLFLIGGAILVTIIIVWIVKR